jgi:hypothetical protein
MALELPAFANANAGRKMPLANHFIYLGNKEMYYIFKISCKISVFIFHKCCLFHDVYLSLFKQYARFS